MLTVFGYKKSTVKCITATVFHNTYSQYSTLSESEVSTMTTGYYYQGCDIIYPLNNIEFRDKILKEVYNINTLKEEGYSHISSSSTLKSLSVDVDNMPQNIPEGSNIYVDPDCNIPRNRIAEKYKKVIKPDKCDYYVIPKLVNNSACVKRHVLFYNSKSDTIYVGMETSRYINGGYKMIDFRAFTNIEGKTLREVLPTLQNVKYKRNVCREVLKVDLQDFLDSVCVYSGYCLELPKGWHYISRIPLWANKVITEDIMLANLGSEDKDMNKDVYNSIKSMIDSNSFDNMLLGLRLLSELDYHKYKNSCLHLIEHSSKTWLHNKSKLSSGVKFMLQFLGCYLGGKPNYFKDSTPEDFKLLQEAIHSEVLEQLEKCRTKMNDMYKFTDIDMSLDVHIKRRE